MAKLKFKSNGKWESIAAFQGEPGKDGAIQYKAGDGIKIENDTITAEVTKDYLDGKLEEFAEIGFTPEIVESLPTEDIKTNIIYMLPGQDGEGENIYEEWMYINNTWEKVGSTGGGAIATGTYYLEVVDKTSSTNWNWSVTSVDLNYSLSSYLTKISEICTSAYNDVLNGIAPRLYIKRVFKPSNENSHQYQIVELTLDGTNPTIPPTTLVFRGTGTRSDYPKYIMHKELRVSGTWTDGVFTATSATYNVINLNYKAKPVYWDNASTIIPTGDYNPATKKYVDDAVANAGGDVDTSNIQEFPTIDLTDYISYTETGGYINITDAGKAKLSELFTNYYKRHNTIVGLNFTITSTKYNPRGFKMLMLYRDELSAGNAYFYQIMFPADLDISYMSYANMNFNYTVSEDGTITLGRIGPWGSDFYNGMSTDRIRDYFLAKSNTTSFTPTGDYHPATKKYVDDAITAAISTALEAEY